MPGRNDPCPCRSGKKFKHCCGKGTTIGPPDLEFHWSVLPLAEPNCHMIVRQRFQSRQWWTLLGFESEDRVVKIFDDIKSFPGVNCETLAWPLFRVGQRSRSRPDKLVILFAEKQTITHQQILDIIKKHGSIGSSCIAGPEEKDFLPISFGYNQALMHTFTSILRQGSEADN